MKLVLQKKIASQNKRDRSHWTWWYREKRDWGFQILLVLRRKMEPPKRIVNVIITSYRNRLLDDGNMIGGCKGLVDALVDIGVMTDDSRRWCNISYKQVQVHKPEERTEIEFDHEAT